MTQEQAQQAPTTPSSGHTPEPWEADMSLRIVAPVSRYGSNLVARVHESGDGADAANADRIVACVNACAGLNPEAVPGLVEALEAVDLWASVYQMDGPPGAPHSNLVAKVRAALAAAKGGAA